MVKLFSGKKGKHRLKIYLGLNLFQQSKRGRINYLWIMSNVILFGRVLSAQQCPFQYWLYKPNLSLRYSSGVHLVPAALCPPVIPPAPHLLYLNCSLSKIAPPNSFFFIHEYVSLVITDLNFFPLSVYQEAL